MRCVCSTRYAERFNPHYTKDFLSSLASFTAGIRRKRISQSVRLCKASGDEEGSNLQAAILQQQVVNAITYLDSVHSGIVFAEFIETEKGISINLQVHGVGTKQPSPRSRFLS